MRKYDPTDPTAGLPTECTACEAEGLPEGSNTGPVGTYSLNGQPVRLCLTHSVLINFTNDSKLPLPEWEGKQKRMI